MNSTLVVFILSIQSSYAEDSEAAADEETFDTLQFFIGPEAAWRIRTFSVDQDVHVYALGKPVPDMREVVFASSQKTCGDIIVATHVFESTEGIAGLKQQLAASDLGASCEESTRNGFIFWVPEGTQYRTRSAPES